MLNDRNQTILRKFCLSLALFVIISIAQKPLEGTWLGENLLLLSYEWGQHQLKQWESSDDESHVIVVDIGDVPRTKVKYRDGDKPEDYATDRLKLLAIVENIAAKKPRAIGIDIDFSPDESGWIDPVNDPRFLNRIRYLRGDEKENDAKAKEEGVPIFLGVHRTRTGKPEMWLGSEAFEDMAASISDYQDERLFPICIRHEVSGPELLFSMPVRLSQREDDASVWCREGEDGEGSRFLQAVTSRDAYFSPHRRIDDPSLQGQEFFVDFSRIELLKQNTILVSEREHVDRLPPSLTDKILILGDAGGSVDESSDPVMIPARQELYPGVYLLASATETLFEELARALDVPTSWGSLALSLLLTVLSFGIVVTVTRMFPRIDEKRLEMTLAWGLVLLIYVIGIWARAVY